MKKTEEDGANFEEAFAAFNNTNNKSGYSPNQLFFLRNWRHPTLSDLRGEPSVEEMVKARDKKRLDRVNSEQERQALTKLSVGDLMLRQDPRQDQKVEHDGQWYALPTGRGWCL